MKRFAFNFIVIMIFALLEIIFFSHLPFLKIKPNLFLLAVVFFTIYMGLPQGLFSAVLSGILKDIFSLSYLAINLLTFVICAIAVNYFKKYLYRETAIMIFITNVAAGLFYIILNYFIEFFAKEVYLGPSVFLVALPEIFLTSVLATFTFFYLKRCALRFSI